MGKKNDLIICMLMPLLLVVVMLLYLVEVISQKIENTWYKIKTGFKRRRMG